MAVDFDVVGSVSVLFTRVQCTATPPKFGGSGYRQIRAHGHGDFVTDGRVQDHTILGEVTEVVLTQLPKEAVQLPKLEVTSNIKTFGHVPQIFCGNGVGVLRSGNEGDVGNLKESLFASVAMLGADDRRPEPWVGRELEEKVDTTFQAVVGVGGTKAVHKNVVLHSKNRGLWPPEGGR